MLSQSERGRKSRGRKEMEMGERERDGGKERAMGGGREGGRRRE